MQGDKFRLGQAESLMKIESQTIRIQTRVGHGFGDAGTWRVAHQQGRCGQEIWVGHGTVGASEAALSVTILKR